jgi:hypothetical protein
MRRLLEDKFTVGAQASVAAGRVGRSATCPPGDVRRVQTADEELDALKRVTLANIRQFRPTF